MHICNLCHCPQHIPQLATWHHAEWPHFHPDQNVEQRCENMQHYLVDDLIPSTWLALGDDGTLLGSAALREADLPARSDLSPWLASVYVHTAQRGHGIGRQLVKHVMDQVRDAGIDCFYLFTPDRVQFYRHLGWTPVEEREFHGETVTVMKMSFTE